MEIIIYVKRKEKAFWFIGLNLFITIVQAIGGFLVNRRSLMSDVLHYFRIPNSSR